MMHRTVRSFGIVPKETDTQAVLLAKEIAYWLSEQEATVWQANSRQVVQGEVEVPDLDLVLILGGDGSIVSVARHLLGKNIPVGGVNFGRVGFLAELTPANWRYGVSATLQDGIFVEERMTLVYKVMREGLTLHEGEVVNDAVLTRGSLARLIPLEISIDGEYVTSLRSDGLIVSTPTGSTGYAGSAGGSILLPLQYSYVIAAICPFLCAFPPMVLGGSAQLGITVGKEVDEAFLTLDGQNLIPIQAGDYIGVSGVARRFLVASFGVTSYFERLRKAGFVNGLHG